MIESGMPSSTELALPAADSNGYVSALVQNIVHEELQARHDEITNANVSLENEGDIICSPCKTSRDALSELPLGQVHCAQILDDKICNMPGIPIFMTGGGRHVCYGGCDRDMHGGCGHTYHDNEMHRICDRCKFGLEPAAAPVASQRITTTSTIAPNLNVSPGRRASRLKAAENLQRQGVTMQRRAEASQGGYATLPLGLVVRFNVDKYDRTKCDHASIMVMVVAQPYATTYTIAMKGCYLTKNIARMYLIAPDEGDKIDPILANLDGVLEDFQATRLAGKGVREFARAASLTGGPGMVSCGCAKSGKCTNCKCAKAGRKCHSGCRCARFCACTNKEPVE